MPTQIFCEYSIFSLIIVLMACVFTFLVWFKTHSGHIICCYFLKRFGDQVGRLVRDLCTFLCCSFALRPSVFLSLLCLFFPPHFSLVFWFFGFFFNVTSTTGSARVPKSLSRVFGFKSKNIVCIIHHSN